MSFILTSRLLAIDLETDSANPEDAHIITAAAVYLGGGEEKVVRSWILKPTRPVPEEAVSIHGYPTERAEAEGADPAECLDLLGAEIALAMHRQIPVVVFNGSFDCSIVENQLLAHNLPTVTERLDGKPLGPIVDPYIIDGHVSHRKGSRRLVDQAKYYGVDHDGAHDATADAVCAARLAYRIAQVGTNEKVAKVFDLTPSVVAKYTAAAGLDAWALHENQVKWAKARADSFRKYLVREGKPADDVNGSWPLRLVKP